MHECADRQDTSAELLVYVEMIKAARPSPDIKGVDVAIFMSDLRLGGVQRVIFNLCDGFRKAGLKVELLVCRADGEMAGQVPDGVRVVPISRGSKLASRFSVLRADPSGISVFLKPVLLALKPVARLKFIGPLARHLRTAQPTVLLAADTDCNLVAVWARALSGAPSKLVLSAHRSVAAHAKQELDAGRNGRWRWQYLPMLIKRYYARADAVVTVSNGVAVGITEFSGLPAPSMCAIYNPIVSEHLFNMAQQPLSDEWIHADDAPLLIAAGRIDPQKDFTTLLHAIALLRQNRKVRLAILGDGNLYDEMKALAQHLGIADAVHFPGFVANPYAYMYAADIFVLSSRFEGLPTVLVEAMACGCAVVSTDCPNGPREILVDGKFGELVPMADPEALAAAIGRTLDDPPDPQKLVQRANVFTFDNAVAAYLRLFSKCLDNTVA